MEDPDEVKRWIREYPWVILVSDTAAGLVASHYPVILDEEHEGISVLSHVGRPDEQLHELGRHEVLMIVQGPHGYVSPGWYGAGPAVPTWNYASVHAYGTARAIDDRDWLRDMLDRLSTRHEAREAAPWRMRDLPPSYIETMLRGIVGIEIAVDRLEGKFKLSQNRPASDRPRIITALERRDDEGSRDVAALMRQRDRLREPAAE